MITFKNMAAAVCVSLLSTAGSWSPAKAENQNNITDFSAEILPLDGVADTTLAARFIGSSGEDETLGKSLRERLQERRLEFVERREARRQELAERREERKERMAKSRAEREAKRAAHRQNSGPAQVQASRVVDRDGKRDISSKRQQRLAKLRERRENRKKIQWVYVDGEGWERKEIAPVQPKRRKVAAPRVGTPVKGKYGALISQVASKHGVPARLVRAVVQVESSFRANVTGGAGEVGLMQIKLATARGMGYRGSRSALYDPATNLYWGTKYLAQAYRLAGGSTCGTILKYNAGHGAKRMNPVSARYCGRVRKILG